MHDAILREPAARTELLDLAIMQKTPERLAPASHFRASGAPVGRNGIGLSPPLRMELGHLGGTRSQWHRTSEREQEKARHGEGSQ
jgi:hypothetical protein